jgi:hypothetical protein
MTHYVGLDMSQKLTAILSSQAVAWLVRFFSVAKGG